jgi:zinc/manganese transport system substrate-binding protein
VRGRISAATAACAATGAVLLAACAPSGGAAAAAGDCPVEPVRVVVSVGQWGDIVGDLAGACGKVTTIISGTSVDPHDYEPTPSDLAAFTDADLVVVNGLGYDAWASRAVDAGGANAAVVDAGEIVGKTDGDNPHLWYGPDFVSAVADAVTGELEDLAPDATPYFDEQATAWRNAMQPYYDEVAELGAVVAGDVTYGATEPVFAYMAQALGLVDQTPKGFARAAGNGVDPAPGDLHDFLAAIDDESIDLLVVNTQTEGAVPDQVRRAAESAGLPVVEVTEAPPDGTTFVSWQLDQLRGLADAVTRAKQVNG